MDIGMMGRASIRRGSRSTVEAAVGGPGSPGSPAVTRSDAEAATLPVRAAPRFVRFRSPPRCTIGDPPLRALRRGGAGQFSAGQEGR